MKDKIESSILRVINSLEGFLEVLIPLLVVIMFLSILIQTAIK